MELHQQLRLLDLKNEIYSSSIDNESKKILNKTINQLLKLQKPKTRFLQVQKAVHKMKTYELERLRKIVTDKIMEKKSQTCNRVALKLGANAFEFEDNGIIYRREVKHG